MQIYQNKYFLAKRKSSLMISHMMFSFSKIYCRGAKLSLVMWDEDFLSNDDFMGQKTFDIFPSLESEEVLESVLASDYD